MALSGTIYLPCDIPIEESDRGGRGVAVYIQDQTTGVLDLPFLQQLNTSTLAADAVVGATTVMLSPGHGTNIGDIIELASNSDGSLFMQARALGVAGDVITICTPVNVAYTTGDSSVVISNDNMAVDGSSTPVVFAVNPLPIQSGDMVRVICGITDNADMDFETFGGINGGLTNGAVMRVNNGDGTYRNLANFKTNGAIELYSYDARYFENNGGGTRGFSARMTWGSQGKHGVVIRLDGALGESLEMVIQDDLTSLLAMYWLAQGSELQD